MLTLSLLRHAKASKGDDSNEDIARPLSERGRRAGPAVAAFMKRNKLRPDLVLCSSALRTRETVEHVWPEAGDRPRVKYEVGLYLASAPDLLDRVRKAPRTAPHLMVVGHNPGLQMLALELIGEGDSALINAISVKLPTAALVVLTFSAKAWKEVAPGTGRLVHFATSKLLAEAAP